MKETTATEWLENEVSNLVVVTKEYVLILTNQAKEMEKERVIYFAKKFSDFNGLTFNEKEVSKEYLEKLYDEYYNETFKSE